MIVHRIPQKLDDGNGRVVVNPEWLALRVGNICSSEVKAAIGRNGMIRKAKSGGGVAEAVKAYIAKVAAERIVGYPVGNSYTNFAMQYGIEFEGQALRSLRFLTGRDFVQIGGVQVDNLWASCDAVELDCDRVVATAEIKIGLPGTHAGWLLYDDWLADEHEIQARAEAAMADADVGYLFAWAPEMQHRLIEYRRDDVMAQMQESLGLLARMVDDAVTALKET